MALHIILKKFTEELANSYGYTEKEEKLFEYFCNYCVVAKSYLGRFDPKTVTTQEDDASIDGIAFIIDGDLISSKDDAEQVFSKQKSAMDTKLIITQVKSSESFKKDEIANFGLGITDFLSLDSKLPNGKINTEATEILKVILNNLKKIRNKRPSIEVCYCTSGVYSEEKEIKASFDIIKRNIDETDYFHDSKLIVLGRSELISLWNSITGLNECRLKVIDFFGMPPMPGIPQSYITLVNAKEFVEKVLVDKNFNIKNEVFEENIRAFLGVNDVNQDIKSTLEDFEKKKLFSILNNGITIVTQELTITANSKEIDLVNYQIINGCQTSNTLFENFNQLTADVNVVVKCIESDKNTNVAPIISATNSQTSISTESFYSLREKAKMVQTIFEINNNKCSSDAHIYFERREGEFRKHDYQASKIFDIKLLCRAYNAMFLDEPHNSARFVSKIFEVQKDNLFKDTDQEVLYYVSALTYYRYNVLVNGRKLNAPKYSLLRWHIFQIYKYIVHGKVEPIHPNSKNAQKYCEKIIKPLHSPDKEYEEIFKKCFAIIDKFPIPSRDTIKRSKYGNDLIDATKNYLLAELSKKVLVN